MTNSPTTGVHRDAGVGALGAAIVPETNLSAPSSERGAALREKLCRAAVTAITSMRTGPTPPPRSG